MLNSKGISDIKNLEIETGVNVLSICADYFMEAPIHSSNPVIAENSIKMLFRLIKSASSLNISDIVIPV